MVDVVKSASDKKFYRYLELENGLKVLLIQDPEIRLDAADGSGGGVDAATGERAGGAARSSDDDGKDRRQDSASPGGSSSQGSDSEGSESARGSSSGSEGDGSESDSRSSGSSGSNDSDGEAEGGGHIRHGRRGTRKAGGGGAVKKAAAALSVASGSLSDPWDLQGLSHFLEHMLFMGSARFPEENAYDAYLAAHGGSSNAFTDLEATCYYFDVAPAHLEGALDRFCEFFIDPLVRPGALVRELQAVDSEFSSALQSDAARLEGLRSHSARKGHVFGKFAWGNAKSLGGAITEAERAAAAVDDDGGAGEGEGGGDSGSAAPAPAGGPEAEGAPAGKRARVSPGGGAAPTGPSARERLLRHAEGCYGAMRSSLVVLGGEPLDEAERRIRERFGRVARGPGPPVDLAAEGPPFEGGVAYATRSIRQEHRLALALALPPLRGRYACKADDYVAHLVGHEAGGSLLAALKRRGWATELSAGVAEHTSVASVFEVAITLTDAGLEAGRGAGFEVVALAAGFFSLLREAGPQKAVWDELAGISRARFRYAEEEDAADYVTGAAGDLNVLPPEHVLVADYLFESWDPELVRDVLSRLRVSDMRVDLQTADYERASAALATLSPSASTERDPWFELDYLRAPLPRDALEALDAARPAEDLAIPASNPFVPRGFELVGDAPGGPGPPPPEPQALLSSPPSLLLDGGGLRAWHKRDARFLLPRTNLYIRISSLVAHETPRAAALSQLTLGLLKDSLGEALYFADLAGLASSTWFEGQQGLDIKLEGFSDKLPLLARTVLDGLRDLRPTEEDFARVLEALRRRYRNLDTDPARHATRLRLQALSEASWPPELVLAELDGLGPADLAPYLASLLGASDLHLEALLHGNVLAGEAADIARAARAALGAGPAALPRVRADRALLLGGAGEPTDAQPPSLLPLALLHRAATSNGGETNSVCELYLQVGVDSTVARTTLDLVEQLLSEPAFDTLRAKEQLGYSVHAGTRVTHGVLGFAVVVVSGRHGPAHLDDRIESFLDAQRRALEEASDEQLERHRQALASSKMQRDRSMIDESDRAWEAIASRQYAFDAREREVEALRAVTREQLLAFYDRHISPGSPHRRKLSVHVVPPTRKEELEAPAPGGVELVPDLAALAGRFPYACGPGCPVGAPLLPE